MRLVPVSLLLGSLALADVQPPADYSSEITKWRHDREVRLKADDGWLSLVGLFWLKEGDNRIGTADTAEVKLTRGPAEAAVITLHSGKAVLTVRPGAKVTVNGKPAQSAGLHSDADGAPPDVIGIGNLKLFIIHRGAKDAIRMKDPESATRRDFTGLKWFPISPAWRIEAKFVPYDKPKKIVLDTMVGEKEEEFSPGYAEFQRDGQQIRLQAVTEDDELFFIFRDTTAGKTTYPAARFLYTPLPKNGKVILDFNRAYNPPCVFTPYATCPLPVPQNRLAIAIPAGEMMYHSKGHR
jgi:uncharacterized protein (DUF1684 family)